MAVVAIVNFRGVGESVKANVVLTCVELTGLLIIIVIGLWAIGAGQGDVSRVTQLRAGGRPRHVLVRHRRDDARLLRHGRLRGFGRTWPRSARTRSQIFPKVLLTGLLITGLDLCSRVDLGHHAGAGSRTRRGRDAAPQGRRRPAHRASRSASSASSRCSRSPTRALINMLMASRLVYGMSREGVLPPVLGRVHRDAAHALRRDRLHLAAGLRR